MQGVTHGLRGGGAGGGRLCCLTASLELGKQTPVAHVWYKAPCRNWYSLRYFLDRTRKRHLRDTAAWQLSAATWNDGLFSLLAACVLTLLQKERRDVGS